MQEDRRQAIALFRHSILGELLARPLRRGEFKELLRRLAAETYTTPDGREKKVAAKTIEEWYYRHRRQGFEGLLPRPRKDKGTLRALREDLRELVLAMKREDPGRSAVLILRELVNAGRLGRAEVSVSVIRRLLRREGLSGPRLELDRPIRLRWHAGRAGELWQTDALHGPALLDPRAGRPVRVKIFALLDDRTRLVPYLEARFSETQQDFLAVFFQAIRRPGVPNGLFLDNHMSFRGTDVQLACAKLDVRLHHARPYDGPAKGKVERFFRTLRAHVLDRLDQEKVTTLDDLNVRLWSWVESEYNRRPHEGLSGRTPLEVFEEEAEEIRFVDDPALLDAAFTATVERATRNDSTCQVRGRTYEVPTHLRGRTVRIGYSLLTPERLFIEDGSTRIPLREVDPGSNARRSRDAGPPPLESPPTKTGLNAVEDMLKRFIRPVRPDAEKRHEPREEGKEDRRDA